MIKIGGNIVTKRTKIMVVCNDINKQRDECLEWNGVLDEHLGKKVKCLIEERRIETPYAIIDFVFQKPLYTSGYKIVYDLQKDLCTKEQNEELLRLALGEKML